MAADLPVQVSRDDEEVANGRGMKMRSSMPKGTTRVRPRAFFDERVCIAEGDGLVGTAVEARAYDSCVAQWLCFKLVITQPGPCPICGEQDLPNDLLQAIGLIGGRYWLHKKCVKAWCTARRAEAVAGLASMGTRSPEGSSA
jgi:hypothetical protein